MAEKRGRRADKKEPPSPSQKTTLATKRVEFASFLEDNPSSTLIERKRGRETSLRISKPWDDDSFDLRIPDESNGLAETLNQVKLPNRLSAIWHKDTQKLEIIWTAHNLPEGQIEVEGRTFSFTFDGKLHECEFGQASDRLLEIARHFQPITMSGTNWRNLQSFAQYLRIPKAKHADFGLSKPRSFWVSNVTGDEEQLLGLVDNLNFYLTYFDARSPNILIHDPVGDDDHIAQRTRYLHGEFPRKISVKPLDSHMLSFWSSAYSEKPMMAFLLYFRVIEYASIHFIDSSIRTQLRKLLKAPDVLGKLDATIEHIAGSLHIQKMDDTQKFKAVLRQCVDPKLLWKDVSPNLAFFSKDTEFDGGFAIKRLASAEEKEETFCTRGVESFSDSARKIRNALSHGKDMETSGVITPTSRNIKLLVPWVHLMATAAGEVVLYKDAA